MAQPRFRQIAIFAAAALLLLQIALSYFNTEERNRQTRLNKTVYRVFTPEGYRLLSLGMDDFVSRMIVLYALYNPLNENIPSINFETLIAELNGASHLDPANIQPYLYTVHIWGLAKSPKNRAYAAGYLLTGLDKFPESWEIPYAVYRLTGNTGGAGDDAYLRMAAERAAIHGGPDWLAELHE